MHSKNDKPKPDKDVVFGQGYIGEGKSGNLLESLTFIPGALGGRTPIMDETPGSLTPMCLCVKVGDLQL
ncbi:MAG: hypothetical protein LBB72_06685 [Spirochaetaceae bacterium]|nr:hypothetical protein [Spirochaetaceae bacterium]